MKNRLTTCLWFHQGAEEAANFYTAHFPDSAIRSVQRAPMDFPGGKAGDVLVIDFTLMGQDFMALNNRAAAGFSDAYSFQIITDDQAETDHYWTLLTSDGGAESQCGWCRDRFGLSWQVTPRRLMEIMSSPDRAAAQRGMAAMMTMRKIDIAVLDKAFADA